MLIDIHELFTTETRSMNQFSDLVHTTVSSGWWDVHKKVTKKYLFL
jgi:hypothetical protein